MKKLRIFISSPSDVRAERVRAYDVAQRLQTKFRELLQIEVIKWEDEPMRATATFQAQLPKPSDCDIVICVLWARIGTKLPGDYKREDGSIPTGTEWEFEDAYKAYRVRGSPDLLVYRKSAPPTITVSDMKMLDDWRSQKEQLDGFLDRWFRDHQGAFQAAFTSFETDLEFEKLLETHLEKAVRKLLMDTDSGEAQPIWTAGSPFRGLEAFQIEHREIFFGRDLATAEVAQRLSEQARRGRVFLMILGMSGCGKSSLVRAGVLPTLMLPGVVKEVECWRWLVLRPGEASGDLTEALAEGLFQEANALPELAESGFSAAGFASLLRKDPASALQPLEGALRRAASAYAKDKLRTDIPEARLILVLDQLEEMFTIERFDAAHRAAFIGAISVFSRGGLVWVVATMRSDMYAYCAETQELLALKGQDGQYDLSPPGVSEIGQIIRLPALAAAVQFESDPVTHQSLDNALQDEASRSPEALPLLEFCLEELYKLRTPARIIAWEAYRQLGGLNGAIANRAEQVYTALSAEAKRVFPQVLASLITIDASASRRPVQWSELANTPAKQEVVGAFTAAHLFVRDRDRAGQSVVAIAHEALIQSWPRVRDWIAENQEFLRFKARTAQAAQRWRDSGKDPDFLLPEGKLLAEADDALRKRTEEVEEAEFIRASLGRAGHRRRVRRLAVAGGLVFVLSVIFGFIAVHQVEQQQKRDALASEVAFAAQIQPDDAPVSLAYLSDALKRDPQNQRAIALAVAELRDSIFPLKIFSAADSETGPDNSDEIQDANFSPDGSMVAVASTDHNAYVWAAAGDGQEPRFVLRGHKDSVHIVRFSNDGMRLLTASDDGTARVWDAPTGRQIAIFAPPAGQSRGRMRDASFSPDSKRVVAAWDDGTAEIWTIQNGDRIPLRGHRGTVWTVRFSPDGKRVLSASADHTARLWNAQDGTGIGGPMSHQGEVNVAEFSPDGKWVVTGSDDATACIWAAGAPVQKPQPARCMSHKAPVNFIGFSPCNPSLKPCDLFVATASSDGTARIWSVPRGTPVGVPMRHDGRVRSVVFSGDGTRVITASYDRTARIWDAKTGLPIGAPLRHSAAVYVGRFSPLDRSMVITASLDGAARIWKVPATKTLPAMAGNGRLVAVCFDGGATTIATVSDRVLEIWNARTGNIAASRNLDPVTAAGCSADGKRVAIASADGTVVRSTETGSQIGALLAQGNPVWTAISRDDRWVLAATSAAIKVREIAGGAEMLYRPDGSEDVHLSWADFSPDGSTIAAYDQNSGTAYLWDRKSGALKPRLDGGGRICSAAFSPDGRWLATASAGHVARIWNTATGALAGSLRHDDWVYDAEFSADGSLIATASANSTAQVWNARTGEPISQLIHTGGPVCSVSFSPNGEWLATISENGLTQLWDSKSGITVSPSIAYGSAGGPCPSKAVRAPFSDDGKWIVTAGSQTPQTNEQGSKWEVRVWDAPLSAPSAPAWLASLAEDMGGARLSKQGILEPTPPERTTTIEEQLSRLSRADDLSRFGRWLATDPGKRSASSRSD